MNTLKFIPAIFLSCALMISCEDMWHHCIDGNGHPSTETRTLPAFTRIEVNGDFNVQVDTGSTAIVHITADENLLERIITDVTGDKLVIESRNGDCLNSTHPIEISVVTPPVNSIDLNGSGSIFNNGLDAEELALRISGSGKIQCTQINANSVTLDLEGSGNIECVADVKNLSSKIEGSGEIRIKGSSLYSELKVIGSGRQRAGELNTDVCTAYISGSGIIDTYVNNSLDVTIIGSGIVNYFGNPVITSYISGSGKIVKQ